MALRELLAFFKIKVDSEELVEGVKHVDKFKERLEEIEHASGETSGKLKKFAELLAVGIFGEAVKEFVSEQIEAAAHLKDTGERLGIATDELQKFHLAANLAGAGADDMNAAIRFLNKNMGAAMTGNAEAVKTFAGLKLEFKNAAGEARPTAEIIADLADKVEEAKSQGEKAKIVTEVLGKAGSRLLPMFLEGSKGVREAYEAFEELGGGIDKNFIKQAGKADNAATKLEFAITSLKSRIAAEFLPGVITTTQKMTKLVVYFVGLAKKTYGLKTAFLALKIGSVIFGFIRLVKIMGGVKGVIDAIRLGLFKFAPFIVIAAALYLIFDDFYTMMQGGDSIIGTLIDRIYGVGATQEVVKELKEEFQKLSDWWKGEGKEAVSDWASAAMSEIKMIYHMVATVFNSMGGLLKIVGEAAGNFASGASWEKISADASRTMAGVGRKNDQHANDYFTALNAPLPSQRRSVPKPAGTLTLGEQTVTGGGGPQQKNDIKIEINGVTDPKTAGAHAGAAVRQALSSRDVRSAYQAVRTAPGTGQDGF